MKKILVAFFAMALGYSTASYAEDPCNLPQQTGVPESVLQEMVRKCREVLPGVKMAEATAPSTVIGDVSEFATLFVKSLAPAAKEIGISVNEFMVTPAGMLTISILLWKFFAAQLLGIIFLLVVGWILYKFLRQVWTKEITIQEKGWWIFKRTVQVRKYGGDDNLVTLTMIMIGVYCAAVVIFLVNI